MTALAPYLLYIGLGAWLAAIVLVVALCVAAGRGDDHLKALPEHADSWPWDASEREGRVIDARGRFSTDDGLGGAA